MGTTTPVNFDPPNGDCSGGACRCPSAARGVLVHERPGCRGQSCRRHPAVSDVPDSLSGSCLPFARVYHGRYLMHATLGTPVQEPFNFKDCSHSAKCDATRKIVRLWCMWYGPCACGCKALKRGWWEYEAGAVCDGRPILPSGGILLRQYTRRDDARPFAQHDLTQTENAATSPRLSPALIYPGSCREVSLLKTKKRFQKVSE